MKLVTSDAMRAIDRECIDNLGIPGLELMEKAGVGSVRFLERRVGSLNGQRVTIICGKGNNGGDGFVMARELKERGAEVSVYLVGRCAEVSGDARVNLERLGPQEVVELHEAEDAEQALAAMRASRVVVDALFGTGFEGEPRGLAGTAVSHINACDTPVLAVDVPSGLNATTGRAEGECVSATWTCTMGLPKIGFYVGEGPDRTGSIQVVDIGIPAEVLKAAAIHDNVLTTAEAAALLPGRPRDGHKGTFGSVLVVAGSVGYTGAAALASMAALRCGAGLVTLGVPSSLNDVLEAKVTEVITRPLSETDARSISTEAVPLVHELLESADALAIGPGVSRHPETAAAIREVVNAASVPCVVDADGLNALSLEDLGKRDAKGPLVLTPHPGEMSRLCGRTVAEIQAARSEIAREVAAAAGATVVLKGASTVVADPDGELYLNPTGNSGLATAGSGDVLTGVIAALLARGTAGLKAAALGAFVHGLAGDVAAEKRGEMGMVAGDVLEAVPEALVWIAASGGGPR